MLGSCCLDGIDRGDVPTLEAAFKTAGVSPPAAGFWT
jgi:hypothetical protein